MIQTDAPITNGWSGGALVDSNGKLIGITTAIGASQLGIEGIGFATPIEIVERVAIEIIDTGSASHALLGILGSTSYESIADSGVMPVGVTVEEVTESSSAAVAGIAVGQVITSVDGVPVRTMDELITALPHAGYDPATYRLRPSRVTHIVEDGSAVDTGDRHFEVLHLPGHSPGSIGLWEEKTGILFSGDCIYDGALLDGLGHSDIPAYRASLKRLRRLPVTIVHAGHEPSFGRARLHELIDAYLARRGD
jgi:hypothetical protein